MNSRQLDVLHDFPDFPLPFAGNTAGGLVLDELVDAPRRSLSSASAAEVWPALVSATAAKHWAALAVDVEELGDKDVKSFGNVTDGKIYMPSHPISYA